MGLLEQQLANGLLNQPATANPKMLAQALKAREQPRKQLTGQGLLDTAAIGLSPVPVIGDALGLAADANRFVNEPESRTPLNFGLAALGLLPMIPSMGATKHLYHGTGEGAFRKIIRDGLSPGSSGNGYLTDSIDYANTYAARKGNPFGNRVLRVADEGYVADKSNAGGDYLFKEKIPASKIEVKVGDKWVPALDYFDESINIMRAK